jgi:hypothetical protein
MKTADEILAEHGIKPPPGKFSDDFYTTCPNCSASRSPAHRQAPCLHVNITKDGVVWFCNHCPWRGGETFKANGRDRGGEQFIAVYYYPDDDGVVKARKVRPRSGKPKCFWQHLDHRGEWVKTKGDAPRLLYRLPELREALANEYPVLIVEGEKDVDSAYRIGLPATCNPDGATGQKWRRADSEVLRGADIVIIPDHDEEGYKHANLIAQTSLGIAKRVRLLTLAKHWPECPKGGDISDWLAAGHTREELDALIECAADYDKAPDEPITLDYGLKCESWWRDPTTIPQRQFLYSKHYIRKNISASIGAGGRLKTSQAIFEAVEMAVGRNLTTGQPLSCGPLHVIFLNAEEEQDELDRRAAAVCQRYNVSAADLGGRLVIKSIRDKPLRIAIMQNGVAVLNVPALTALRNLVEKRADVFILDPWISFHSVRESSNEDMDLAIKEGLGKIAIETNSAGEILHHPGKPKPGQIDTAVEDARGASAIIWAVRSARVFNFMTSAEAQKLGISEDDRRRHIRIANGKANMAPLGKAEWVKIGVENLPNGDEVAVSSCWKPPDPFEGVSTANMETGRKLAATGEFRADMRSPDWFGYKLADLLHIPVSYRAENNPKDLARLHAILKKWLNTKVLRIVVRQDGAGRKREFIAAGTFQQDIEYGADDNIFDDDDLTIQ